MKKIILLTLTISFFSCDQRVGQELPLKEIPLKSSEKLVGVEVDIKLLKKEVAGIQEKRVLKNLNEVEKIKFSQSLEDLKKSLNRTTSLMKKDYSDKEKRELRSSYAQTKEIWDYLIKNYKI